MTAWKRRPAGERGKGFPVPAWSRSSESWPGGGRPMVVSWCPDARMRRGLSSSAALPGPDADGAVRARPCTAHRRGTAGVLRCLRFGAVRPAHGGWAHRSGSPLSVQGVLNGARQHEGPGPEGDQGLRRHGPGRGSDGPLTRPRQGAEAGPWTAPVWTWGVRIGVCHRVPRPTRGQGHALVNAKRLLSSLRGAGVPGCRAVRGALLAGSPPEERGSERGAAVPATGHRGCRRRFPGLHRARSGRAGPG